MNQAVLLRVHRWISITFALPLLFVIVTGLILSVQPLMQSASVRPGSLDASRLDALIAKYDPNGAARSLSIDTYANRLRLGVPGQSIELDLATGERAERSAMTSLFQWARRTHERLLFGMGWLVTASTIAMLATILMGALMGLPRLRNSVSGWHKGMAWCILPLIVLSPLTGLFLAFGITLGGGAAAIPRGKPIVLREAIRLVATEKDLARLSSIGVRGGITTVRLDEGGELRAYALGAKGLTALPRNWPRLIHEGNWSGLLAGLLNVVISLVLLGLLGTGVTIFLRRTFRRRAQRGNRIAAGNPSGIERRKAA